MTIRLSEIPTQLSLIKAEFREPVNALLPTLQKIDLSKISDTSGLRFDDKHVHILINPINHEYAGLDVYIGKAQLIVGYAESEQYENHHSNEVQADCLNPIEKYLAGIRIRESFSKSGKLLKREYWFQDNTEIGTSVVAVFPNLRAKSHNEISLSFLSA